MPGFTYILASKRNGTLYVGVTKNLARRIWEHRQNLVPGFTRQHSVHCLVYIEQHDDIRDAIVREKQLKRWKRTWKLELIEGANPEWDDLYDRLSPLDAGPPRSRG